MLAMHAAKDTLQAAGSQVALHHGPRRALGQGLAVPSRRRHRAQPAGGELAGSQSAQAAAPWEAERPDRQRHALVSIPSTCWPCSGPSKPSESQIRFPRHPRERSASAERRCRPRAAGGASVSTWRLRLSPRAFVGAPCPGGLPGPDPTRSGRTQPMWCFRSDGLAPSGRRRPARHTLPAALRSGLFRHAASAPPGCPAAAAATAAYQPQKAGAGAEYAPSLGPGAGAAGVTAVVEIRLGRPLAWREHHSHGVGGRQAAAGPAELAQDHPLQLPVRQPRERAV